MPSCFSHAKGAVRCYAAGTEAASALRIGRMVNAGQCETDALERALSDTFSRGLHVRIERACEKEYISRLPQGFSAP
jgi:hypothetical protein